MRCYHWHLYCLRSSSLNSRAAACSLALALLHACYKPESGNGGGSLLTPAPAVTAFYHVLAMKYLGEIAGALGDPSETAWLAKHARIQPRRFYSLAKS